MKRSVSFQEGLRNDEQWNCMAAQRNHRPKEKKAALGTKVRVSPKKKNT